MTLTITEYINLLAARDAQIREQQARISELEEALNKKELELDLLKRSRYGQSSEKMKKPQEVDPTAPSLFPDFDGKTIEVEDNTLPSADPSDIVEMVEEESRQRRAREKRKKKEKQQGGRRILRLSTSNLERDVVTLYPEGYDPETMEIIGKESTITLEEQQHKYYLKEVVRVKCVRKSERGSAYSQILQAPLVPRILENGYLGDSIIADILINKYCHHLPEYRQAKMFKEYGLDIPTSTINRAVHQVIDRLYPLYYAQMKAVVASSYVHMDETTIKVNDREGSTRKAYLWDMVDGCPKSKGLFFYYREGSRSQEVMQLMLDGYKGAVQVDGYKVYESLAHKKDITVLNCMAHARRKFENIKDKYPQDIPHILHYFSILYQIEANLKERKASIGEIQKEREEKSKPILASMEHWLRQKIYEVTPKSALGEAINYTLTRWDELCTYITNGIYQIDNNPVERSIRPIALGRKNWLFVKDDAGGEDLAVIMTLIQSCELLGVNPREWLLKAFSRIAGQQEYNPIDLLPFNYVKETNEAKS